MLPIPAIWRVIGTTKLGQWHKKSPPPQVAQQATQTTRDLGGALTLLGTFGSQNDPHALLKLRGGKTATVSRGDIVNGQTVVAIEEGRVALARNGTARWLEIPAPRS